MADAGPASEATSESAAAVVDIAIRSTPPWRAAVVDLAIITGSVMILLTYVFDLLDQPLRVPFDYRGDSVSQQSWIKTVIETGWYSRTERVGAPFGREAADFPLGTDNLHWLIIKVLGWFTDDAALVLNLFFLGSFVLIAISAYLALRWLMLSRIVSIGAGIVYAFAPYHFLRGTGHEFLGAYYAVPLALVLVLRIFGDDPPFVRDGHTRRPAIRRDRSVVFDLIVCAVVASANGYYALFTIVLALVAGTVASIARRAVTAFAAAAASTFVLLGVTFINLAPTILQQRSEGQNPEVAQRNLLDIDAYPLRPIQMLSPVPGHRIDALAEWTGRVLAAPNNSEISQFLGLLSSVGLMALLVSLFARSVGSSRSVHPLVPAAGVLAVAAILLSTSGGLAWIIGLLGYEQIRAWNRLSIVLAFLGLFFLAAWFDRVVRPRFDSGPRRRALGVGLAALTVIVAVLDQTSATIVPDARRNADQWNSDKTFVQTLEARLQPGDEVFQLPFVPFPEHPPVMQMVDYDHLRPYLHSRTLKWSYGGMRAREAEWQRYVAREPTPELVDAVTAAGFEVVYVDRFGYADGATAIEAELVALLGEPLLVSPDGREAVYDLRLHRPVLAERLGSIGVDELADQTLEPVILWWSTGCSFEELIEPSGYFRWCSSSAEITATRREGAGAAVVRFRVHTATGEAATLMVGVAGDERRISIGADDATVEIPFDFDAERVEIRLGTDALRLIAPGDPRDLRIAVEDLVVEEL